MNFIYLSGSSFLKALQYATVNTSNKFLDNLAFGSFNKVFKNPRTNFDWLTRDDEIVDKYIADPYCGGICSVSFFKNLTSAMANMGKEKYISVCQSCWHKEYMKHNQEGINER